MTKFGPVHALHGYTVKVRGELGCAIVSHETLIREQIRCYLSSRPNGVVDVFYHEQCGTCRGAGRLRKGNRRSIAWKPCSSCAGSPELHPDELLYSTTV